jgi:hypothetical protein
MDKDQVKHFADQARQLLEKEPTVVPSIAIGYGKAPWPIITETLKKEGFDPAKNLLIGKSLYKLITGDPEYHRRLLQKIDEIVSHELGGKRIIDAIEIKVKEMSDAFKKKYKTVDDLLLDTF